MIILLSLGTIISVDARKSVLAFQNSLAGLNLSVNVVDLFANLTPVFQEFNKGVFSEEVFQKILLNAILGEHPKPDTVQIVDTKDFFDNLLNAWNYQLDVDIQAENLIQSIIKYKAAGINVIIYSDTNETHFKYLEPILNSLGLNSNEIYTTFSCRLDKIELTHALLAQQAITKDNPAILVLGNAEKINILPLKQMTTTRDQQISSWIVSQEMGINIKRLNGARLTSDEFTSLFELDDHCNPKSISPARKRLLPNG